MAVNLVYDHLCSSATLRFFCAFILKNPLLFVTSCYADARLPAPVSAERHAAHVTPELDCYRKVCVEDRLLAGCAQT